MNQIGMRNQPVNYSRSAKEILTEWSGNFLSAIMAPLMSFRSHKCRTIWQSIQAHHISFLKWYCNNLMPTKSRIIIIMSWQHEYMMLFRPSKDSRLDRRASMDAVMRSRGEQKTTCNFVSRERRPLSRTSWFSIKSSIMFTSLRDSGSLPETWGSSFC